jgi:hypothetical protein
MEKIDFEDLLKYINDNHEYYVINSNYSMLREPVIDAAIHGYMKLKNVYSSAYNIDDVHNVIKDLGNYNELYRKIMFCQMDDAVKKWKRSRSLNGNN